MWKCYKNLSFSGARKIGVYTCNRMTASHEEKALPEITLNTTSSAINIGYDYYTNFNGALVPSYHIGLDKFIVVHSYRQGKRTTEL